MILTSRGGDGGGKRIFKGYLKDMLSETGSRMQISGSGPLTALIGITDSAFEYVHLIIGTTFFGL